MLFQLGKFKLNSGAVSEYKIDCDALTDEDWKALAWLIAERLPLFSAVEGVPTGGLKLAEAMQCYVTPNTGPLLIVDDVMTSGGSMERWRRGRPAIGAVVFARLMPPSWITPLFKMTIG